MRKLRVLTNSEVKCYRSCPRKHWYRYVRLRRPIERAHALAFGSLVHTALEAWWLGCGDLEAALTALRNPPEDADEAHDPVDLARAEVMLRAYHWQWHDAQLWVMGVEQEFLAPLIHPETGEEHAFAIAGKLDALAHDEAGRVWIVEHKTSAEDIREGSLYFERLKVDTQISTYCLGVRAMGHEPAGVLYDVLGKPGISLQKATPEAKRQYLKADDKKTGRKKGDLYASQRAEDETVEEYTERLGALIAPSPEAWLKRVEVLRLDGEEHEAVHDLWMWADRIEASIATGTHPRNPEACRSFGRMCEYFPVCTGEADIDDDRLFRAAEAHEELNAQEQPAIWDPEPTQPLPI